LGDVYNFVTLHEYSLKSFDFQVTIKKNKFSIELFISTMSRYPYPMHTCWTLKDLDDYPLVDKRELKSINAKFQVEVGYWAFYNHLQDYNIYGTMIKMFYQEFLNSLWQPPRDNPWPMHSTIQNYRMRFHR